MQTVMEKCMKMAKVGEYARTERLKKTVLAVIGGEMPESLINDG